MKYLNFTAFDHRPVNEDFQSNAIDMNQLLKLSIQAVAGPGSITGSIQLQVSNDIPPNGYLLGNYEPTNWDDLGSPVTISATGSVLVPQQDVCYRFLRINYSNTATGAVTSTITTISDNTQLAVQTFTFQSFAATGQDDYFIIHTPKGDSAGIALDKAGLGAEPTGAAWAALDPDSRLVVDISATVTADDVANAVKSAIQSAFGSDVQVSAVTSGSFNLSVVGDGPVSPPQAFNSNDSGQGSVASGLSAQGTVSNLQSRYFLINSTTTAYYVWINLSDGGDDPNIFGLTGVEVDAVFGSNATTIAAAIRTAFGSVSDFTPSGSGNTAILTNTVSGPAAGARNGGDPFTGFGFAVDGPTSSLTVNVMALSW